MHLLKSLLKFSSSTGLQHLKMARDQKIFLKASRRTGQTNHYPEAEGPQFDQSSCRGGDHDSRGDRDQPIESLVLSIESDLASRC